MNVKTLALCTLALAGCAAETPEPNTPTASTSPGTPSEGASERPVAPAAANGAEAVLHIDENLGRLRALGVFDVGNLVIAYPQGTVNCYGPCPGSEPAIAAAKQDAALRLATFTDRAVAAAKKPTAGPCDESIEKNLASLRALSIVDVTGFDRTSPDTTPNCYTLDCPGDTAAAEASVAVRSCKLEAIVRATKP